MKVDIKIPSMGESVSEATVSAILKPSGSFVKEDEEIIELETDKVNQVLYAPKSGIMTLTIQPAQVVKIGQSVGFIDTQASSPSPTQAAKEDKEPLISLAPSSATKEPARIMPSDFLSGLKEEKRSELPPPATEPVTPPQATSTRKPMSTLRKTIAQRLVQAKNSTAMLTTFNEIDMSTIIEIRNREKENLLSEQRCKSQMLC